MPRKLVTLLAVMLMLTACTSTTKDLKLTIATGFPGGVYNKLGAGLADAWSAQLGMPRPVVLESKGSPENLQMLAAGKADIAFSAADVAIDDRGKFTALARIYDDYLHIVVRDSAPITVLADLAGKRISIGAQDSGVAVIAKRVLEVAKLHGETEENLGLRDSSTALREGRIDAFFWSGGLPTDEIVQLAKDLNIRLLDLTSKMPEIRKAHGYYGAATIPLSVYGLKNEAPVTTLVVPNLLLVNDRMPVDAAKALTQGIFEAQQQLAGLSKAASSIDIRSAIETYPVPMHEGAIQYYRDKKI